MNQYTSIFCCPRHAFIPISVAGIISISNPAFALPNCTIFSHQAEKGIGSSPVKIKVGNSGTNIIIPDEEIITKAWLDDFSQIGIDSDGTLCPSVPQTQQNCSDRGATVLHLKRIKQIDFPYLVKNPDGSTLLTAISRSPDKRKVFTFQIVPISGHSECPNLTIVADPNPLTPLTPSAKNNSSDEESSDRAAILQQQQNTQTSDSPKPIDYSANQLAFTPRPAQSDVANNSFVKENSTKVSKTSNPRASNSQLSDQSSSNLQHSISDARAVERGLEVAKQINLIQPLTVVWLRTKKAIIFLSQGDSISSAAQKVKVSPLLLTLLVDWGQRNQNPKLADSWEPLKANK